MGSTFLLRLSSRLHSLQVKNSDRRRLILKIHPFPNGLSPRIKKKYQNFLVAL
jgi:hypothetical protein